MTRPPTEKGHDSEEEEGSDYKKVGVQEEPGQRVQLSWFPGTLIIC